MPPKVDGSLTIFYIKDEKNNKIIKEIEEKVKTKISFTDAFVESDNIISDNYDK